MISMPSAHTNKMLGKWSLVLLVVVGSFLSEKKKMADAHLWMMCPLPRQCFYESPLGSNDGDGEWRRFPCPFSPGNAPQMTTVVAGETLCLRVREFVDHVGHFDINLATVPVSPGDEQSLFTINLRDNIPDLQNGTSFQQFYVDIPSNITCNPTCTLQVRQWSDDLNWYYYACSDIQVVNRSDLTSELLTQAGGTCQDRILDGTCEWESGTPRVRIMILSMLLFLGGFTVWLVGVLFSMVLCFILSKCCRRQSTNTSTNNDNEHNPHSDDREMASDSHRDEEAPSTLSPGHSEGRQQEVGGRKDATTTDPSPPSPHWLRSAIRPVALLTGVAALYMISAGIATILMKTCNYSGAHGSELSF